MSLNQADIAAAIRDLIAQLYASPAVIGVVSLPFCSTNPEEWFAHIETQFQTRQPPITADNMKYNYVVAALDYSTAVEVKPLLLRPPPTDKYNAIKKALMDAFTKSQDQKDAELLQLNGLGGRRPSSLLRHIQSLNADPQMLLKAIFLAQLPVEVRRILTISSTTTLDDLAKEADRIVDAGMAASSSISAMARINKPVQASFGQSPSPDPVLCYFHLRFGAKARNCKGKPCPMANLPRPLVSENTHAGC